MRVLFDQGTPAPLRNFLSGHEVSTAYELDWSHLSNGELLKQAENGGFDVLITTDRNLRYQQNLAHRKIAIVVLGAASWPRIQGVLPSIIAALNGIAANAFIEVPVALTR